MRAPRRVYKQTLANNPKNNAKPTQQALIERKLSVHGSRVCAVTSVHCICARLLLLLHGTVWHTHLLHIMLALNCTAATHSASSFSVISIHEGLIADL
jgi:hypothetical protein